MRIMRGSIRTSHQEMNAHTIVVLAKPYHFGTVLPMTILERLIEVAAVQRGYVTTRDALDLGINPVELRKLKQRGRLERHAHGLYRLAAFPHQEHDELMRASLWADGRGVISHESAIALWNLADVNPSKINLTVPPPYRPRRQGGDGYRVWTRPLNAVDTDRLDGIPVVIAQRAIIEAANCGMQFRFVEQAIHTSRGRRLFGRETEERIREQVSRGINL